MMLVQEPDGSISQGPNTVKRRLQYHETYDLYELFTGETVESKELGGVEIQNTAHPDVFNFILTDSESGLQKVVQSNPITVDELLGILEDTLDSDDLSNFEQKIRNYSTKDVVSVCQNTDESAPPENTLRTEVISHWVESFDEVSLEEKYIQMDIGEKTVKITYTGQILYSEQSCLSVTPYAISPNPPVLQHRGSQYQSVELTELELFVLSQITFVYDTLRFSDTPQELLNPYASFCNRCTPSFESIEN